MTILHTATISDARSRLTTTRRCTPEGYLRAKAHITRSGIFEYMASELGVPGGDTIVRVLRTDESIFNPETYDSVRGTPLTLGHPDAGVNPDNWRDTAIGNSVGNPIKDVGGMLTSDILVGDREGLDAVDNGVDELSIGYTFSIEKVDDVGYDYDYVTVGPVLVNHIALVDRGRAGSQVRIFDQRRSDVTMDQNAINQAVQTAINDALAKLPKSEKSDSDVSRQVSDAVAPVIAQINEMKQAADKKAADEAKATAEAKAQKAADDLKAAVIADERKRAKVIMDVAPFIPEDKKALLDSAPVKDILVAAVGDRVADAANKSEDYLSGVVSQLKADAPAANTGNEGRNSWADFDMTGRPVNVDSGRTAADNAHADYVKHLTEAYKGDSQIANGEAK